VTHRKGDQWLLVLRPRTRASQAKCSARGSSCVPKTRPARQCLYAALNFCEPDRQQYTQLSVRTVVGWTAPLATETSRSSSLPHSQPWSIRSHIRRDLTSVHSSGICILCGSDVLDSLLFPISGNCTILVLLILTCVRPVSSCAPLSPVFKLPWDLLDQGINTTSSLPSSELRSALRSHMQVL